MIVLHTSGGLISCSGFALLGLLWLVTGWMAFVRIREGKVDEHCRWMMRNFALCLAAVMLRAVEHGVAVGAQP